MADVTETRHGPGSRSEPRRRVGVVVLFSEAGLAHMPPPQALTAPVRVGRDEGVELRLADSQISREHARLSPAPEGVLVTDLGSRNGTFIDGNKVDGADTFAPVGSCLRLGKTLLAVVQDVDLFRREASVTALPLVGGPRLAAIRRLVATVGATPHAALVLGETGTGKERVAEALHQASGRAGRFVAVNCSAIPADLIESELFGHAKGAFSGSHQARTGLFRQAQDGTLFLDEVFDLPLGAQAKLLRALETGEVRAVGEDQVSRVDVRIVAATNVDLVRMAEEGRFRSDLLHRLSVWRIDLPPLRERSEDVPLLAWHFLPQGSAPFSVEAMELLVLGRWPGNVRQLRSSVLTGSARAAAERAAQILPAHLDVQPAERAQGETGTDAVFAERVKTALQLREGNVAQVARDLDCGRPWLYQELKRLSIDPGAYRKRQ